MGFRKLSPGIFDPVKHKIQSYHIVLAIFCIAIVTACSTTKNTWVTRTYHNVTARYNGYFYAKESMKDAADKIEKTYVDDYTQMLPVFRIPNTPETKGSYADLEKAIKKSTLVIEHHAITNKANVEVAGAVKWIDENYLIIGQAHYYKSEFIASIEIFDYIINKYPGNPTATVAMMWKARAEIQLGDYTAAEGHLDAVKGKALTNAQQGEVKASYADLYMHTGNYANAIKYLEEALPLTKGKKTRARYLYILGQLYEQVPDCKKASDSYGECIKLNPDYVMLFNAKLNRSRLSSCTATNHSAAKRDLEKMLLDEKNLEYRDQIYYTLGQLEQPDNKEGAIKYYKLSVASSMGNNKQKALAYLALGDLNFDAQNYKQAGAYYDSTMMFLPKDFKNYEVINDKKTSLARLVHFLNIVTTEDSLQNVVKLYGGDTSTLYAYIDKKIDDAKKEEERKKKELEDNINNGGGNNMLGINGGAQGGNQQNQAGQWYFYNPSTVGFGVGEFNKKWGNNRKLEDNWRRANKEQMIEEVDPEKQDTSKKASGGVPKNQTRDYYLKDLPLTKEGIDKSNDAIADALYNLGGIYKDQMSNYPKAIEAFTSLTTRFPDHKYALTSHFQLYRIYQKQGDKVNEQKESDFICKNYPESDYCQLIKDPGHETKVLAEREKVRVYYDSTYMEYTRNHYAVVVQRCNYADSVFGTQHEHAAKFAYIRALSLGKTQGTPQMETALVKLIENFPKDPLRPQAQLMLDYIRKTNGGGAGSPAGNTKVDSTYKLDDKVQFQYMVIVQNGAGDINKFRTVLSDFNTQNYASANLTITSMIIDATHQAVIVKNFGDQSAAMSYYNNLKGHPEIFAWLGVGTFQPMVISTLNFPMFLKNKDIVGYKKFFDENILNKK
jgi:tetratricopeptide (TPR) repeat protein